MSAADPHLMLAFEGTEVPDWLRQRLDDSPPAGVSLFREWNMTSPGQVAELTSALQAANSSPLPLLIAVDQEGGQLIGLAGSTEFAGNMAIGATGDADLASQVAGAMGRELAAVGINVNYAPVADVASRADNPSLGIRSFGDDPEEVARLTGAMVTGFNSAGVLATLKHFPGSGEASVDPHYELPRLDLDRDRLEQVELRPFQAGVAAGAGLLMVAHQVVPALTDSHDVSICASEAAINGFVRSELGFDGLVISDALDMGALDQGPSQVVEIIAMMRAGTDLLLCMPDPELQDRARMAIERGHSRGLIGDDTLKTAIARVERARSSIRTTEIRPELVGSPSHLELAKRLAEESITLVRDDASLIPLRSEPGLRILALEPEPFNVTPADTTALYSPQLAEALRARHPDVTEVVYPHRPEGSDISAVVEKAEDRDLIILGTVTATPGQVDLANVLLELGKPLITVALRTPFDLASYPGSKTHVCTYSSHRPSLDTLTFALFGDISFQGHLPAAIPGLYPRGHGIGT
ncbi:MAG TPA: glycoside hydrolase family 3 N-terminal domain-containing protein [Acidimicrobiia bacterium]|nr:glycoside hydrolase family 3 N-terminal domain-containing protein [Acidimicrobiia bacterium]